MRMWIVMTTFILVAFVSSRALSQQAADLVLRNGTIITVDQALAKAQAIAVRGDRIAAVGSNEDIAKLIGPET